MKSNVSVFWAVAAFCLATWSCSGEEDSSLSPAPEIPEVPANPDALCTITPSSVAIAPVDASKTPLTRSATGEDVQQVTYAENLGNNSSVEVTLEAMPQEAQTRANLASNVKYRVVVYDITGAIVKNLVYTGSNTTPDGGGNFQLNAGIYRLFAYSFNTTTVRELSVDGRTVHVTNADDFMTYTDPNFTIGVNELTNGKKMEIKFVRQFAKLILTMKAEEYTNNTITAASATLSNIFGNTSWEWNGTSRSDNSSLPIATGNITLVKATGNGASVDCGVRAWTPYISMPPCSGQTIKASQMYIVLTGTGTVILKDLSFPNVTLAKGGSYRLTITSGNYYVLTNSNPVVIGGKKWARANLQQQDNSTNVFIATNPWDITKWWGWGMRNAEVSDYLSAYRDWTDISGTYQDPCRALSGGWRLPTKTEASSLITKLLASGKVKINGVVKTVNSGWTGEGAVYYDSTTRELLYFSKTPTKTRASCWTSTHQPKDNSSLIPLPMAWIWAVPDYNSVYCESRGGASLRCVQN